MESGRSYAARDFLWCSKQLAGAWRAAVVRRCPKSCLNPAAYILLSEDGKAVGRAQNAFFVSFSRADAAENRVWEAPSGAGAELLHAPVTRNAD